MARRIGEVFVSIEADTKMFRTQAFAGVKKALAGLEGKIPVTADTKEAITQVEALKRRMELLNRQLAEIKIGANGKPAESAIRKIQLQLKDLAETIAHITVKADTTQMDAAMAKERATLAALREQASNLKLTADNKQALLEIARLDQKAFHLRAALGDPTGIPLDIDRKKAEAELAAVLARVAFLKDYARKVVVGADIRQLLTAIAVSEAAIDRMKRDAADMQIGGKVDLATLAAAEGRLVGLEDAAKRLNPELDITNTKLIRGAGAFGRFGLGALTAKVALFGGLRYVSGWHIALDTVIESLAVIVPALVTAAAGLLAFGVAGSDAARAVYNRLQNIHTVADATNSVIGPMTGKLEALHAVVRPQVWQLYGDAIAIAHTKTDLFGRLAVQTGGVIDRLAGRLTVLATTSGPGLTKFLESGSRDLAQFGRIFLSLGDAFGKLIQVTEQTHIAETLLKIVNAGAKLIDIFTKLPLPILAAVIAVHGIYLWSGLAATALTALLRPFGRLAAAAAGAKLAGTAVQDLANAGGGGKFARLGAAFRDLGTNISVLPGRIASLGKSFLGLFASPWTWVVVGAIALAGLAYALSRTKSSTDRFIESINTLVSKATDFTIINTLGAGLIQTTQKLGAAQGALSEHLKNAAAQSKIYGGTLAYENNNINQSTQSVQQLTTEHEKLSGQLSLVGTRLGAVAARFGTNGLAGAEALAAIAGVKVNQLMNRSATVWAGALQQINGVVQGYANMGQGTTQLANDLNVLTIAQSDQLKNIQTLNSAFDNFTKIVSGPISGFLTLANTLKRFGNDAGVAGAQMSGLGSGMTGVSKKVTDASLQLQNDFQDTFNAATQMADAMRLTGTASSVQVQAIKDVVQVLIPMAGSNKAAAAEISALAQEAGGHATTNLKELAKWAGKTKDPLGAAQKAAAGAAIQFSNMSLDAQKLGSTLAQDLTGEMAKAVENAVGLQGAMNNFAKAMLNSGTSLKNTERARQVLYADLAAVGIKGPQATAIINALSGSITRNGSAAVRAHAARLQLNDDIQSILNKAPGARSDIDKLTRAILSHGTTADQKRAARQKLIDDLRQSGVDAKTAKRLVDNLQTSINAMHGKTVRVNFVGSGSGSIAFKESIPGVTVGPTSKGLLGFHAAGGKITGGTPGRDSVLGMLMPGEVVVPTQMVKAGAVDHLRGRLPGFAGGGVVGTTTGLFGANGILSAGQPFMARAEANFGRRVEKAFFNAVLKKFKADMAAALGGSGSSILAYAESFKGKAPYVWGGNTPRGWDCSGFVEFVYRHFGIGAPGRPTAATLQNWAHASAPVPGGMAFYGTPAHHVGFVVNNNTLLSALGRRWGTVESALNMGDNSGYGIPPRGFAAKNTGIPGGGSLPKGKLQELAFSLLNQYQWGNQWAAFNALENREAGWRMDAQNPTSHAYGLAQFINGPSEYFQYGGNPNTAVGQLTAMMNYISSRYGSPAAAWRHEQLAGWYGKGGLVAGGSFDSGGVLAPGWNLAWNGLGRKEHLVPAGDGEIHVHIHNEGVIGSRAELDNWVNKTIDRLARNGRLGYAFKRSFSAT